MDIGLEELKRQSAIKPFIGGDRHSDFDAAIEAGNKLGDRPNIQTCNAMLTDPGISFPLHMLKLPVSRSKLVYSNPDPDIRKFVNSELEELSRVILFSALTALEYGFAPFERRFVMVDGKYHYKEFYHLKPEYVKILIHPQKKNFNGLEQGYKGHRIDLPAEMSYVFAYQTYFSNFYGKPQIDYAYVPWILDKEFYRYHGLALQEFGLPTIHVRAPEGNRKVDMGEAGIVEIPNLEFMKLIGESVRSRSVVGTPPGEDWFIGALFEKRQVVWDYNKDHEWLDRKKALGLLVPPDIWREGGGSFAKAKVQTFWFEQTIAAILGELKQSVFRHIIKPIIRLNFWDGRAEPPYGELHGHAPSLRYQEFMESLIRDEKDKSRIDWPAMFNLMRVPIIENERDNFGLSDIPTDTKSLEGLCRKAFNRGIEIGKEELAFTGYIPLSENIKNTLKDEAHRLQFMLRQTSNPIGVIGVVLGRLRSEGREHGHWWFSNAIENGKYQSVKETENVAA